MNKQRKVKEKYTPGSKVLTVFFIALCLVWVMPVIEVLINSFKSNNYVNLEPFALPTEESFVGLANYIKGVNFGNYPFIKALGFSLFITVVSVALILLFCSMTAWYIVRTKSTIANIFYYLCLFSMIVPFQMVMFTLSKFANILHLGNPVGIIVVYLGFGAGLAVFMFTGFVKSISLEIEEAAMIDGCSPVQTFFKVVLPIMKPTVMTVTILESMWIWNDYLLPALVLNINKYKTIPIAVQYLKQSHGNIDWGAMMAVLVMAIIPIVIFYAFAQKYIIEGVLAGAVKG